MQKAVQGKPLVIEICPASTLADLKINSSYKGGTRENIENRYLLVRQLKVQGVEMSLELEGVLIGDKEGDALDSVIAALAVWRNLRALDVSVEEIYMSEGMVYV